MDVREVTIYKSLDDWLCSIMENFEKLLA